MNKYRNINTSPFNSEMSSTKKGLKFQDHAGIVTVFLMDTFDESTGKGFLKDATRYEACWNRFIKSPGVYPIRYNEVSKQWKEFVNQEMDKAKECLIYMCLDNGMIKENMVAQLFRDSADHEKLPKEYAAVQKFANTILNNFIKSEFCQDLERDGFFRWVDEMEKYVEVKVEELNMLKKKLYASEQRVLEQKVKEEESYSIFSSKAIDSVIIESKDKEVVIIVDGPREFSQEIASEQVSGRVLTTNWEGSTKDGVTTLTYVSSQGINSSPDKAFNFRNDEERLSFLLTKHTKMDFGQGVDPDPDILRAETSPMEESDQPKVKLKTQESGGRYLFGPPDDPGKTRGRS